MQSFLKDTLNHFLHQEKINIEKTTFILPGKRAGSFLRHLLKTQTNYSGFVPEILSIEELATKITGLKALDKTNSLFRFYQTYCKVTSEEDREKFETFYSWAQTLIEDFNEIDRYLIPTQPFFNYLSDIKNIEHWSLASPQTEMVKNYLNFWNNLANYHEAFIEDLLSQKEAYQGLIFRIAAKQINEFLNSTENQMVFIGFNALNKAEQHIIQTVLSQNRGEVFWDIDKYFLDNKTHEAGRFIRSHQQSWAYYQDEKNSLKWIGEHYSNDKTTIETIGIPQNIGQAKYVGSILEEEDLKNTAVILNDEGLLFPILNSLPAKVDKVNITMGLALDKTPPASLFETLFKIQNDSETSIYHKNVLDVLTHPVIKRVMGKTADKIRANIISENLVFISLPNLTEQTSGVNKEIFENCFTDYKNNIPEFLNAMRRLTELLRPEDATRHALETQYLFQFNKVFKKLSNLLANNNPLTETKTFHRIYTDILQTETLDFSGTPFDGLQIMGMLESRVLDYETVILTSVNEGKLPGGKSTNSFIPYDLKRQYGLPTYREKDAVYSYHFYRLLQRAKKVYLLYNSETSGLNSGEKSRFITQLEIESPKNKELISKTISPKVNPTKLEEEQISITKTPEILDILKKRAAKGFSPSALTTYIRNPVDFYKRYVLGIQEEDEVEETVAARTLGTVVHDTLEVFYKPFEGRDIHKKDLDEMLSKIDLEIQKQFAKHYSEAPLQEGKNLIIFEIAKRFILNFLNREKQNLKKGKLTILHIESDMLRQEIDIPEFDFPIYILGKVDRVDRFNDQVRIIDYKTGNVITSNLRLTEPDLLTTDEKYNQAFQVLSYASMLQSKRNLDNAQAGVISFKNLKEDFMPFKYKDEASGKELDQIDKNVLALFQGELKALLREIFDINIPFTEKE
ncbi:MAG TPA: PD-(D/E)XK nuclease family protein [Flavobacteriaceae bacterium]|nr:PD-(D/E)XK nuclease family protein [Flavobacteriaceae bacterium]